MQDLTEFLSDSEILGKLCEVIRASDRADLAIAYWGANATKTLEIQRARGPVRILCDAYSGACNPDELATLLELKKKVCLRTRNGLHAKILITPTSVIVGSANASANGLGQEDEEAKNLEAAAVIHDQHCIEKARDWFESIWKDARDVDVRVIREIGPMWRERRRTRPAETAKSSSLYGVFLADPGWFKDREIRIVAYDTVEVSKAAQAKFAAVKNDLYLPKILQKYDTAGQIPFYEDDGKWDVSAGEYIVDYVIDKKKRRAMFGGLWRVRSHNAFHKAAPRSRIILCDKTGDFKGLPLSKSDGNRLGKLVFEYVASKNFKEDRNRDMLDVSLDKAAEILLP